jgi:hypothetical protein
MKREHWMETFAFIKHLAARLETKLKGKKITSKL